MTTNSSLTFESQDLLPSMDPFLIPKELPPPPPSQLAITKNIHFETLSRLNVDIHKSYDTISKFVATQTFEDFICMQFDAMNGYENIKMVVKSAQEFLVVIKALHRQMGVKVVSRLGAHDPLALTMDPELLGVPTPSTDTSDNIDDDDAFPSHDAPTMFLVISCYVQLIKHLELVFNLVHSRITDKATAPPNPAPMMSFADVPLIEASTQFVLFCELVSHVLGQINLVLGLPSPWAERSVWIGLLKGRRYREMVNAELGSVEGGVWTERPGRLMDKARATKELFAECSMMGF
ncbi:Fc.00g008280.m01.CDS01 [Cosmosporella sp. VM-42]